MQLSLFENTGNNEIPLYEYFEAYFSCRRNKRTTTNAIAFETDYEAQLVKLYQEVNDRTYAPGRSVAFIVNKPVQREIFAAEFRDRIIHHLLINKLNPLFEKEFIYDCYACRKNKGTLFGIRRADRFIRKCSENYTKNCFVLKLDIEGFFMYINRKILYERLNRFISTHYKGEDVEAVLFLIRKTVYNQPIEGCVIKGRKESWQGLPTNKSLFCAPSDCGLPIGNLTSQIFANFYMTPFDHFIKHGLRIRYYGRYMDDFIIIHPNKEYLKSLIPIIRNYLKVHLGLTLHPRKIYLQHYSKGVKYLGAVIKPGRLYIGNRTVGNFSTAVQLQNKAVDSGNAYPGETEKAAFLSSMNSYLGMMKHYKSYRLRTSIITRLSPIWWQCVAVTNGGCKFVLSDWHGELIEY